MFVRRWDGSDEARILNAVRVFGFGRVLKNRWVFALFCKLLIFIKLSRAKVILLSLRSEVVVILQRGLHQDRSAERRPSFGGLSGLCVWNVILTKKTGNMASERGIKNDLMEYESEWVSLSLNHAMLFIAPGRSQPLFPTRWLATSLEGLHWWGGLGYACHSIMFWCKWPRQTPLS